MEKLFSLLSDLGWEESERSFTSKLGAQVWTFKKYSDTRYFITVAEEIDSPIHCFNLPDRTNKFVGFYEVGIHYVGDKPHGPDLRVRRYMCTLEDMNKLFGDIEKSWPEKIESD